MISLINNIIFKAHKNSIDYARPYDTSRRPERSTFTIETATDVQQAVCQREDPVRIISSFAYKKARAFQTSGL